MAAEELKLPGSMWAVAEPVQLAQPQPLTVALEAWLQVQPEGALRAAVKRADAEVDVSLLLVSHQTDWKLPCTLPTGSRRWPSEWAEVPKQTVARGCVRRERIRCCWQRWQGCRLIAGFPAGLRHPTSCGSGEGRQTPPRRCHQHPPAAQLRGQWHFEAGDRAVRRRTVMEACQRVRVARR